MALILLVRHGQNDWVKKNRLAGWTPGVHLNEDGQKQVKSLADRLSEWPIKAIYSSPLERCMETAAALAQSHNLEINQLETVGEVRYGK
ncbi:MAG: phosphoglycerate mutase, partial [Phycisphaerae bacterium]|nr:phosphoglycerate mutase [Phycisphaerae bacterium]NIX30813.1 phosphoglycerate mutase [Phycisphaerae bacterium]